MSINKNALMRYKVLDNCFRNPGRRYFIYDLIDECNKVLASLDPDSEGISRRQIFEDIAFMESTEGWGVQLERFRDGRKVYYRYSDISFSINNMPLNEVEIDQLQSALDILSQFKGMPQFEWVHELLPKLQQGVLSESRAEPIIDFDNNEYLKGIENIGQLYNAIHFKKVLEITYQSFDSTVASQFIIHPYYLKQYNNRWFLFGLNQAKGKYDWNLPLDRIISINEIKSKYIKNTSIKWQEYFEDIIGVTKPADAVSEKVIFHVLGKTGRYIESKPLHGSQKSKWIEDNVLEVSLELIINYEFERVILSYGESIKVLSPLNFKQHIATRLLEAVKNY
jgi:predicted DNA-binding transcriptional regulator YafY